MKSCNKFKKEQQENKDDENDDMAFLTFKNVLENNFKNDELNSKLKEITL